MNLVSKTRVPFLIVSALILLPPVAAQFNYGSFGAETTIQGSIGGGCPPQDEYGRHQGGDGSAAASDKNSIRGMGAGENSLAIADRPSKTVKVYAEAWDGSCSSTDYLGQPITYTAAAVGQGIASFYDTYTVSSETLPLGTEVEVMLRWELTGSFTAMIPKGPNGGERARAYLQIFGIGAGVVRDLGPSQGTQIRDSGDLPAIVSVGDSFHVTTLLSVGVHHTDPSFTYILPRFVADFSASAVVLPRARNGGAEPERPNVVVTGWVPPEERPR